jgi:hypothetical protein
LQLKVQYSGKTVRFENPGQCCFKWKPPRLGGMKLLGRTRTYGKMADLYVVVEDIVGLSSTTR